MTQAWQHEIYLPHWYHTLEQWANNLRIVPLGWCGRMSWWCRCCRSPSHNESWPEKIDSPTESPKCLDALFGRSVNIGVLQREWPVSHTLAHPHGLSLIDLEHNLKFQGIWFSKPDGLVLAYTGWEADLAVDLLAVENFIYSLLVHRSLLVVLTPTRKCQSLWVLQRMVSSALPILSSIYWVLLFCLYASILPFWNPEVSCGLLCLSCLGWLRFPSLILSSPKLYPFEHRKHISWDWALVELCACWQKS
jgi:hypothetical protein